MKTDWMLDKLKTELASGRKYDVVTILGGSNDIYGDGRIDRAERNLDEMYRLAKSSGAKVVAITPPNKDFFPNATAQKQELLKELVRWIGTNPTPDHFINLWHLSARKDYFAADYQHLNNVGQKALSSEFKNKVFA